MYEFNYYSKIYFTKIYIHVFIEIEYDLGNYGDIPYGKALIGSLHRPKK